MFHTSNPLPIRGQHLFQGGTYLKIGRDKEIFSFNLTVYFLSVRKFHDRTTFCKNSGELKNIAFDEKKFPMLF